MDRTTYRYYERLSFITRNLDEFAKRHELEFNRLTVSKPNGMAIIFEFYNRRTKTGREFTLYADVIKSQKFDARVYVVHVEDSLIHSTAGMINYVDTDNVESFDVESLYPKQMRYITTATGRGGATHLHLDEPSMNNGYFTSPFVIDMDKSANEAREYVKDRINKYFDKAWEGAKEKVMQKNKFKIEKVIFNNPATIVFWADGTKTVVKATNEAFDEGKGLAMAISKKALGNQGNYFNEFKKWLPVMTGTPVPEELNITILPSFADAAKALKNAADAVAESLNDHICGR